MSLSRPEVSTNGAAGALRSAAAAPSGGIVDFAAMIAAAEAEVVKARADQLAASDRLAREVSFLKRMSGSFGSCLNQNPASSKFKRNIQQGGHGL